MYQQQVNVLNYFRMILDALAIIAAAYGAWGIMQLLSGGPWTLDGMVFTAAILVVMFSNNYVMGRLGLYSDRRSRTDWAFVTGLFKAVLIDFAILTYGISLFSELYHARLFIMYFGLLSFLFLLLERALMRVYYERNLRRRFNREHILMVGDLTRCRMVAERIGRQLSWGHEILGYLTVGEVSGEDVLGTVDDLPEVLHVRSVDEVIFALDANPDVRLGPHLDMCRRMGISASIVPSMWDPDQPGLTVEKCQEVPLLAFQQNCYSATGLLYKRLLDIVGGIVGSLLCLVLYPFVALAIKIDSPGPVLFKQPRAGLNGRTFRLYKFRTMYVDAEERKQELMAANEMQGAMFKMENDPRITRVGGWLRKTSLDEFPQFLNVLRGEISLVGTRPPTLDEVERYEDWHYRRISAKPGITGLWQISGRNKITDFDEIVSLDCQYIEDWRFWDDVVILCKTVGVVLRRKGAV